MLLYMLTYMEYLEIPTMIIIVFVAVFLVIQVVGELLEFKGKVVPEFCKIRKYFARKKQEREIIQQMPEALKEIKDMFNDFSAHYSEDNIMKRDKWIDNVNKRIEANDEITKKLDEKLDTLLIENKRNEIIDFASRVGNPNAPVTREYFDRIFKMYKEYEDLIEETGRTNGEVDISYKIIRESYESHTRNHTFVEDARGWK